MPRAAREFKDDKARFRCELPSAWTMGRDDDRQERDRVYGIFLVGKKSRGVSAMVGIDYYAPDNRLYGGATAYLERQLSPSSVPLKGETTGPVEAVKLSGREAKRIVTDTVRFYPPMSLDSEEVPVRQERVVLPFEGGFFVLTFSTPAALYKELKPDFDLIMRTFRPLRP